MIVIASWVAGESSLDPNEGLKKLSSVNEMSYTRESRKGILLSWNWSSGLTCPKGNKRDSENQDSVSSMRRRVKHPQQLGRKLY